MQFFLLRPVRSIFGRLVFAAAFAVISAGIFIPMTGPAVLPFPSSQAGGWSFTRFGYHSLDSL